MRVNDRPLTYPSNGPADLPGLVPMSDGWMSDVEVSVMLGFALLTRGHVPGGILEVGAYKGRTTSALVHAVTPEEPIVVVDTFRGGSDNLPDEDFYADFRQNTDAYAARIRAHIGDSRTVLPTLHDRFRLALIDGDHATEPATADLVNAWALLSDGGYLFVDDIDWPSVQAALLAFSKQVQPKEMTLNVWGATQKLGYVRKVDGRIA